MKVYLLDKNKKITDIWKLYFKDIPEVKIVCDDFKHLMSTHFCAYSLSFYNERYGFPGVWGDVYIISCDAGGTHEAFLRIAFEMRNRIRFDW